MSASASRVRNAWCDVMSTFGNVEQPRQDIVLQDLAGEVLEEDAFFLLVNVQRHAAEASGS